MNRNSLLVIFAGLLFGIGMGIIILTWFPAKSTAQQVPPGVGLQATDFTVDTLDGAAIQLTEYRGKPVILNFWTTWCPPCKEEMPLFDSYAKNLGEKAVFIAMDTAEEDEVVNIFVKDSGISLLIGMDRTGQVADNYFVRSFPQTFFIDQEGIIRAQHIGQLDEKLLKKYLGTIGIK